MTVKQRTVYDKTTDSCEKVEQRLPVLGPLVGCQNYNQKCDGRHNWDHCMLHDVVE